MDFEGRVKAFGFPSHELRCARTCENACEALVVATKVAPPLDRRWRSDDELELVLRKALLVPRRKNQTTSSIPRRADIEIARLNT